MQEGGVSLIWHDGQQYEIEAEVWELGSLVCTSAKGDVRNYEGLSKDADRLPHYCGTGSSCLMLDTGDFYKYHKETDTWYKL